MRGFSLVLVGVLVLASCDSDSDPCDGFDTPEHTIAVECGSPDLSNPRLLAECQKGAGHMGSWAVDGDGLPAFDFRVEERCDEAAHSLDATGQIQSDPIHLLGNGRGLLAMAHASGGVELYSQDRGHKWINHIDSWRDDDNKSFPVQLGGGFNYLVVDGKVRSTRFEDNPISKALGRQTRRFGVGYVETVTTFKDLRVTRRVFAPDTEARALVAEVKLENLTSSYISVGVVEFWDLNQHQLPALETRLAPGDEAQRAALRRDGREVNRDFEQTLSYSKEDRVARSRLAATSLPAGVTGPSSPSLIDYFPAEVFLATIDNGPVPDAVWLSDDELWKESQTTRPPPSRAAKDGDSESRELAVDGDEQAGILALRVQVSVPTGSPVIRRFAMGYATPRADVELALTELRAQNGELAARASESWARRLAWVAASGPGAGLVQRELAWSSYYVQAHAAQDELRGTRSVGAGGAAQFVAGFDGTAADLSLAAETLLHLDPLLARETLLSALSSQHGADSGTPYRFPYSTAGVDGYATAADFAEQSDAYFMLPSAVARYVAQTRDFDFLDAKASFWPVEGGEVGSVLDHLSRSIDYANNQLGLGARGFFAMGSGDFEAGILSLADEPVSSQGSSSVFNAAIATYGFPLLVELLADDQPDLADAYAQVLGSQADALENQAFNGDYYDRAYADSGNAIAGDSVFLSSQVLPILAGMTDELRRDDLLELIADRLDGPLGAVSQASFAGSDRDLMVSPVLNAWLTEAISRKDAGEAWLSLLRNTMATRADLDVASGYAPWTGPAWHAAPDAGPVGFGESAAIVPASDYPALGTEAHLGPLRALVALLGVRADRRGFRVEPRMPDETFAVALPRLSLSGTPTSIEGSITGSRNEILEMVVRLPSGALSAGLAVKARDVAVEFDRGDDDTVRFALPIRKDEPASFSVRAL